MRLLGYPDGELDQRRSGGGARAIAGHIRRIRPHVVITFGPDGAYGHPDHIAISPVHDCRRSSCAPSGYATTAWPKLYYIAWSAKKWAAYQAALKKLTITVDGVERQVVPVARLGNHHARRHHGGVADGVARGAVPQTQMAFTRTSRPAGRAPSRAVGHAGVLPRVQPVNGGRRRETDLFEGLR